MSDINDYNDSLLKIRTNYERPVMNKADTPEYINLSTHYTEREVKPDEPETLIFHQGSTSFIKPLEDDEVVSGNVKPSVTDNVSLTTDTKEVPEKKEKYQPKYFVPDEIKEEERRKAEAEAKNLQNIQNKTSSNPYFITSGYMSDAKTSFWDKPSNLVILTVFFLLVIAAEAVGFYFIF